MARPKSQFLKAAGTMWEIWHALVDEVLALGGSDDSLRRILTDGRLRRALALLIVNGIEDLRISLVSIGYTGVEWVSRLKSKGFRLSDLAREVLYNNAVITTSDVAYDSVVIMGKEFETDATRTTEAIRLLAKSRGYLTPPAEVSLLLRELITDDMLKKMGLLSLVVMHNPIINGKGQELLLAVYRYNLGRWLHAFFGFSQRQWSRDTGFVFLAPRNK